MNRTHRAFALTSVCALLLAGSTPTLRADVTVTSSAGEIRCDVAVLNVGNPADQRSKPLGPGTTTHRQSLAFNGVTATAEGSVTVGTDERFPEELRLFIDPHLTATTTDPDSGFARVTVTVDLVLTVSGPPARFVAFDESFDTLGPESDPLDVELTCLSVPPSATGCPFLSRSPERLEPGVYSARLTAEVRTGGAMNRRILAVIRRADDQVASEFISWNTPSSGAYGQAENWNPQQVPTHSASRADRAFFGPVTDTQAYTVTGTGVGADTWEVAEAEVSFQGSAGLFRAPEDGASLLIGRGGALELVPGTTLTCEDVLVGIGGGGEASLRVRGAAARCNAAFMRVGDDNLFTSLPARGRLEVLDGATVTLGGALRIAPQSPGTCVVRGLGDATSTLLAETVRIGSAQATGTLNVQSAGKVVAQSADVAGDGAIDVGGAGAEVTLGSALNVSASASARDELTVNDGGTLTTAQATLGAEAPSDLNQAAGVIVSSGSTAESKLRVTRADATTDVGARGVASLEIFKGGFADLAGGLVLGPEGGARGTALVASRRFDPDGTSERRAELKVGNLGLFVGVGAASDLTVEDGGLATILAPVFAGVGPGLAIPSRIVVKSGGEFNADGQSMSIGVASPGELTIDGERSTARCAKLEVGVGAFGSVRLFGGTGAQREAVLNVTGDVFIGALAGRGAGNGVVTLGQARADGADDVCRLVVGGRLKVGDAGSGTLSLTQKFSIVEAALGTRVELNGFIDGIGKLKSNVEAADEGVVAPGIRQRLEGSFDVVPAAPKQRRKPVLQSAESSIGELTIEGDYDHGVDALLEIEVAGTAPGQFDVLHVTGNATLNGTVDLKFIDGFVPQPGDDLNFVVVDGTITGKLTGAALIDAADGAVQAEVEWEVTPEGTCRVTVTNVSAPDDAAYLLPPECGDGLCGAGAAPLMPLTLLGFAARKAARRRCAR